MPDDCSNRHLCLIHSAVANLGEQQIGLGPTANKEYKSQTTEERAVSLFNSVPNMC